jgi:cobalt/nickel transport system permease protein
MASVFLPVWPQSKSITLFNIGSFKVNVAPAGWLIFKGVLLKGVLSVFCLILLTSGTPFPQLLAALEDLKFPRLITMILSFMYRYIFLIEDEALKMWRAMKSRCAGGADRLQLKAMANMAGILFIRSFERGEAVYLAMCSRGYDGTVRRSYNFGLKRRDLAFLVNIIFALISIKLLDNFFGR